MTTNPYILIIEDDPTNRKVLKILLQKKLKFEHVEEWSNSVNFLEKFKEMPTLPDLVIMDIMLPPTDGFGMIEQIRQEPTLQQMRVVAHTASVMQDQVLRMKESGFDGLISKPIMRDHFPQLIHRLLDGESIWYVS